MVQRVGLNFLQSDFLTLNGDPTAFRGGWGFLFDCGKSLCWVSVVVVDFSFKESLSVKDKVPRFAEGEKTLIGGVIGNYDGTTHKLAWLEISQHGR